MEVLPLVLCAYNYLPECQVHSGAPILMKAQALQRHRRLDVFRSRCGLNGEAGQICVWRDNLDEAIRALRSSGALVFAFESGAAPVAEPLQPLQLARVRHFHAAILRPLHVERRVADPVLAAQVCR